MAATADSGKAAALARSLGAGETINFGGESVGASVARLTDGRGSDLVFNTVGGCNRPNSFAAAVPGGRFVTTDGRTTVDISPMHDKALSPAVVFVTLPLLGNRNQESHGRAPREIARLADAG